MAACPTCHREMLAAHSCRPASAPSATATRSRHPPPTPTPAATAASPPAASTTPGAASRSAERVATRPSAAAAPPCTSGRWPEAQADGRHHHRTRVRVAPPETPRPADRHLPPRDPCWRCGFALGPVPQLLVLGHVDGDKTPLRRPRAPLVQPGHTRPARAATTTTVAQVAQVVGAFPGRIRSLSGAHQAFLSVRSEKSALRRTIRGSWAIPPLFRQHKP